jgi:hypothetical protein
MSEQVEQVDWQAISERLRAPFNPNMVDFRVQGKTNADGKAQVVAYIDARSVQDRLDEVVGAGGWSFTWEPVTLANNELHVVKGSLTIHGVTREDVGTASNFDPSKGAVSDALKRCAVTFGVGRYLYDIPSSWVTVNKERILPATLTQLRTSLPRPDGTPAIAPARSTGAQATPAVTERPQQPERAARQQRPPAPAHSDAGRPTAARDAKAKASAWLTIDGYDPLSDMELRAAVKRIGILSMADFETFLRDAQGYRVYDHAAINATLTIWEARHEQAQATLAAAGATAQEG